MKLTAAIVVVCTAVLLSSCRPSPEKLLATANKYHGNKQYKEADILYQKVIAKDKKNAEAYYREGLNLLAENQPAQAVPFFRRAVDLNPSNQDAESKLAEVYLMAYISNPERFKTLIPEITDLKNKILQRNPNSFEGLRLQGMLAFANRNVDAALDSFAKANQVKPYSRNVIGWYAEALVLKGQPDKAEALVKETLDHDKTWPGGYSFLFALAAKQNNPAKEEQILRDRVQNDPKNGAAIAALADFLARTNRQPEGEAVMKRVLDDKNAFPQGHEMMGDYYSRERNYSQAISEYEQGAKDDSKRALIYRQRVVLMYSLEGQPAKALDLAKNLAQENPKDTASNELYASLLLDTGLQSDANKSVTELKSLTQKDPTNPILRLDLARAYFFTNHSDDALRESLEAMTDETKNKAARPQVMIPARLIAGRVYQAKGQNAQALEQADQVLQTAPQNPEGRLLRDKALMALSQGDQAKPDLQKLVAQADAKPGLPVAEANEARLLLADYDATNHDFAGAEAQFDSVWKTNDVRGFEGIQRLKLAQGKTDDALDAMSSLVNSHPTALNLRYDLANMQAGAGLQVGKSNPDKAHQLFNAAADNYKDILKSNANSSDVWLRLSLVQRYTGQNDAALASLEQAINADPHNTGAMVDRGLLLQHVGRTKEAIDIYNRILGTDPDNPIALNNLAFIDAQSKTNLQQAQSYAERAKKREPHSLDISDTLGYVYYQRNLNPEALQIFRQDVEQAPDNAVFHYHLAMALAKQGDKKAARDEVSKALRNAPPDSQQEIRAFASQLG